jgi:hypothetical protein
MRKTTINTTSDFILKELQLKKVNHIVTFTNLTTRVETETNVYVISQERINNNMIFVLMNKVKNLLNMEVIPEDFRTKIRYNRFNADSIKENLSKHNLIEIDIVSAYFTAAIKLGYLTESDKTLIDEAGKKYGLKTSEIKKAKLMALGSTATRKEIFEYIEGAYQHRDLVIKETEPVFFHLAYEIDQLMHRIADKFGNNFFFFWVDAVFVSVDIAEQVKEFIKSSGYECTQKEVKSAIVRNTDLGLNIYVTEVVKQFDFETRIRIKHFFTKGKERKSEDIKKLHYEEIKKYKKFTNQNKH